jgi:hypothetical protein
VAKGGTMRWVCPGCAAEHGTELGLRRALSPARVTRLVQPAVVALGGAGGSTLSAIRKHVVPEVSAASAKLAVNALVDSGKLTK